MNRIIKEQKNCDDLKEIVEGAEGIDWKVATALADVAHVLEQKETPLDNPPALLTTDETVIRNKHQLFQVFCKNQIFEGAKGWDTTKTLPWKVDSKLHAICSENDISKKQAAAWWLQLRRSHGKIDSIKYDGSTVDGLKEQYKEFIRGDVVDTILAAVVKECSECFDHLLDEDAEMKELVEHVFGTQKRDTLRNVIACRVNEYNEEMANQMVGMTVDNKTERISKFLKWWQGTIHGIFVAFCHSEFNVNCTNNSNHIFVCLENELYKAWNNSMNAMLIPKVVTQVEESQIEKVVLNAGGLLYYIAGWLLNQLQKLKSKKWKDIVNQFIDLNSLAIDDANSHVLSVPKGLLETREKHKGKLKRVTSLFYRFVEIVEALYKENLENPQVVWALKENLFTHLFLVTKKSYQIDKAFQQCLPNTTVDGDAQQAILFFLLQKYNTMRAGDYIRKLKLTASFQGVEDNFSVRTALMAAHMTAVGKTPSAIEKK